MVKHGKMVVLKYGQDKACKSIHSKTSNNIIDKT